MSASIKIRVDASQLLKYFDAWPRKMKNALDTGLRKAAALIEGGAKRHTPVDTGRLRASIHSTFGYLKSTIGTNTNYAVYVHQGTRFMRPRPFMTDGVDSVKLEVEEVIDSEISKALK